MLCWIILKVIAGPDLCLREETVQNRNLETGHHLHHLHGRAPVLLGVRRLQEWGELQGTSSSGRATSPGPAWGSAVPTPSLHSQHSRGSLSSDGQVETFFSDSILFRFNYYKQKPLVWNNKDLFLKFYFPLHEILFFSRFQVIRSIVEKKNYCVLGKGSKKKEKKMWNFPHLDGGRG